MKVKQDEENFDEAEAQAYRCWSEAKVCCVPPFYFHLILTRAVRMPHRSRPTYLPSSISQCLRLLQTPTLTNSMPSSPHSKYSPPHSLRTPCPCLPHFLTCTLPQNRTSICRNCIRLGRRKRKLSLRSCLRKRT
jgi:hypothetical protein